MISVIGKGGETIHRLIDQAHCHIQVNQGILSVLSPRSLLISVYSSFLCLANKIQEATIETLR